MITNYNFSKTWNLFQDKYFELFKVFCISILWSFISSLTFVIPFAGLLMIVISPIFVSLEILLIHHILRSDEPIDMDIIQNKFNECFNHFGKIISAVLFPYFKLIFYTIFFIACFVVAAGTAAIISDCAAVFLVFWLPISFFLILIVCFMVFAGIELDICSRLVALLIGEDDSYEFTKEFKTKCRKKIWWLLIPVIGQYMAYASIIKSSMVFYRKDQIIE